MCWRRMGGGFEEGVADRFDICSFVGMIDVERWGGRISRENYCCN
jgi:hypothetical protein